MCRPMTQIAADAVQTAAFAALQGSTGLAATFASMGVSRVAGLLPVFDHVPRGADGSPTKPYPFVAFGSAQDVPASPTNDCDAEVEAFIDVEIWDDASSRGRTGTKRLAASVTVALARILTVTGFSMTVAGVESVRHLPEADGVARSVLTLRYLLDPA
jgi:hypothetical protein